MKNLLIHIVTELEQERDCDKDVADTFAFSSRQAALEFLHGRYLDARLRVCGIELEADYSDDGWYSVSDSEGNLREGRLSQGVFVD